MHKTISRLIALGSTIATIMLAGCGGGSGGTASPTVSGIAATGMPITGQVHLKDSSAASQERSAATAGDGSFVINVSGLTAPFIVKAEWTDATGPHSLLSFTNAPGTANITPLSHVIVANAAGVGDPSALYESCTQEQRNRIAANLNSAVTELTAKLKPLFDAYGVGYDPISGPFAANHVGLDAMLDAINIQLTGSTVMVSNRGSGAVIFSAPVAHMADGSFVAGNMPMVPPGQTPPAMDGSALYAAKCAGCHDPLASSPKQGASVARIQSAITANMGGMGSLSSLNSMEIQAIAAVLAVTATPTAPSPAPVPSPLPQPSVDGASLYAAGCASCHGPLATSDKKGITVVRLQGAINNNIAGMGSLSTLSSSEMNAIVNSLATAAPAPAPMPGPTPTPVPAPTPAPAPAPVDGVSLYGSDCAICHGPLASSGKIGATVSRIQGAINNNIGGMGYLSTLAADQVQAIATALATVTPAPNPTPPPAPACGSCHTIPPSSGQHSTHSNRSCATCHGSGYSSTGVNAATHNNGVKNIVTTIGWSATNRNCANSCHGTERW